MRRPRRVATAVSVAALLVAAGGCGDDEAADSANEPSAAASEPAADETPTVDVTPTAPAPAPQQPAAGEAVEPDELLDRMKAAVVDATSAHVTMKIAAGGQEIEATGDLAYAETGNALDLTMVLPGAGPMRMIAVDGQVYAQLPGQTETGKFLEIDPDDPTMGSLTDDLTSMDPLSSFAAFDAGLRSVTYLGEETVDGTRMGHYRLDVDSAAASKAQGESPAPGLPETISYDLWLDRDDLMRRIDFDLAGTSARMTMSKWGEPVDITAPPRLQIIQRP